MKLKQLDGRFSVLRYAPDAAVPSWVFDCSFYCISKTDEELSIVCPTNNNIQHHAQKSEDNWACLKVEGPLDFSLTGILSSIAAPLAAAKISIFAVSTFDTDYILLKADKLKEACDILTSENFEII